MGKIILILAVLMIGSFGVPTQGYTQANDVFNSSGLPIPRFVSLRSDKVFVRTGPALRYPIKWVYKRKALPVEIIQEFDTWRKIKDIEGEEGWIHQSLLSGRRSGVVSTKDIEAFIYKKPETLAKKVAQIEQGALVKLESCGDFWCEAEIKGFSGWIEKKLLWGVYQDEEFD